MDLGFEQNDNNLWKLLKYLKKNWITDMDKMTWIVGTGDAKQCPDKKTEIDLYEKSESCHNEKCESEWWPEL